MTGVLVWGTMIIISATIFLLANSLLSKHLSNMRDSSKSLIAMMLSAIVVDLLSHIAIIVDAGFTNMMAWAPISFPFVGLCLILTNFVVKTMYEWKR